MFMFEKEDKNIYWLLIDKYWLHDFNILLFPYNLLILSEVNSKFIYLWDISLIPYPDIHVYLISMI